MDISVLLGLLISFGSLILAFLIEGGTLGALLGLSAALIVLGGTIGATLTSYSLKDILKTFSLFVQSLKKDSSDTNEKIVRLFVQMAEKARSEGLLSLEAYIASNDFQDLDPMFKECIELVIDGGSEEYIRTVYENRIDVEDLINRRNANIFEAAGGYSPTMGIIGTVMGLIHVLGNVQQPDKLAPSIAAAFIATLYGVSMANFVWLPISQNLKNKFDIKRLQKELILEGSLSLQAGENPRVMERKLRTFIINHQNADEKVEENV